MHVPPVVEKLGAPGPDFRTWEIIACATNFTGIISLRPASGSTIGVTIE
jgi:hypothetical protein